jgi:DUF4097 and DUF4098 domain-containing protein YvlB
MTLNVILFLHLLPFIGSGDSPATIDKEFQVSRNQTLEVDIRTGGALTITGWDKDIVKVHAELRGRDAAACKVDVSQQSGGVSLTSEFEGKERNRNADLKFEICVPEQFNLSLESMGGPFTIEGVAGRIEGKTMGGPLTLHKLKGKLELTTMGGPVALTNSDVDGFLKTMGGEVRFEDVTGDVQATTMGGRIIQKNVRRRSGESGGPRVDTRGGDIEIEDAPDGTDIKTMGGTIHIKRAKQTVRAETMGGDIEVDAIDGAVQAKTMGGDVTVVMVGDPSQGNREVSLQSMGGEINLTVPSGLSMDIEVTLAYTKGREGDYDIKSDFDLKREKSSDWEYRDGSPRKFIIGTAVVAGGKNKIRIKTINGNVHLKKG